MADTDLGPEYGPDYKHPFRPFYDPTPISRSGAIGFSPDQTPDNAWQNPLDPNAFTTTEDEPKPTVSKNAKISAKAARALNAQPAMPPPGVEIPPPPYVSATQPAPQSQPAPAAPPRPPDPTQQQIQTIENRMAQRTPPQQIGQRPQDIDQTTGKVKTGAKVESWAQRLGMALLSATKLAPYAQQIIHPQWTQQMGAYSAGQTADLAQLKGLESASGTEANVEERQAIAEQRRAQAADYAAREQERQRATEEKAATGKEAAWGKQLGQMIKGREGDVAYLPEDSPQIDQLQQKGYQIVRNPIYQAGEGQPGQVIAIPPAMIQVTPDMLPYMLGHQEGDLVPWSEHRAALADFAKRQQELIKEQNATHNVPVDQQYVAEYLRLHPGSTVADAVKAHAQDAQSPQRPPQALMVGPDGRVMTVGPGSTVPQGAVTPTGLSSENVPTAATRSMAEKAPRVRYFVDQMKQLLDANEKQLGPLKSRWREFTAGRVGLPDKSFTQLRTFGGLLETALMNMHVGARGGEKIMEHFHDLINTSIQDPDNLRAALDAIGSYADQVAKEGRVNVQGGGGGTGMIQVQLPDGTVGPIHPSQLQNFLRDHPGAKQVQ